MDSDEWNNIYQALDYPYNASVGKDGMEQAFESHLHGVPGKRAIETNDQGKVVSADDNWKIDERTGEPQAPSPATTSSPLWTSSSRRLWSGPWPTAWAPLKSEDTQARRRWLLTSMTAACWPPPPIPPMICLPSSRTIPNWPTTHSTPVQPGHPGIYPPGSTF